MPAEHRHRTHPDIVKRLKRSEGHLRAIAEMIEAGRACLDVAQQLHAVEKAIKVAHLKPSPLAIAPLTSNACAV